MNGDNKLEEVKNIIAVKISEILGKNIEEILLNIEEPKDSKMGDYSFPCFSLSKEFKTSPMLIAEDLKNKIQIPDLIEKTEVASGYLNFYIDKNYIVSNVLKEILTLNEKYLETTSGKGKNICIDYSAPNIAKPFHIGHLRSTVIGAAIYNLYKKQGYNVIGINHLGDFGTQFGKVIEGYNRWGTEYDIEKSPIKSLVDIYVRIVELAKTDETIDDIARENFKKLEEGDPEITKIWSKFRELSLKEYERIYKLLGSKFDSYNGEAFYNDKMTEIIDMLNVKKVLIESEGAKVVKLDGYDIPCMIIKSNGSTTYTTRDLAAALYRARTYDFYKSIYVTSYEQKLHFEQLFKVASYILDDKYKDKLVHVPFGMVLGTGGKKISTRGGVSLTLEDILNEAINKAEEILISKGKTEGDIKELAKKIGVGAIIFNDLKNNRIKDEMFNLEDMLKFDSETGPYVQYMYVRTNSILEKSNIDILKTDIDKIDLSLLVEDDEVDIVKLLGKIKEIIKIASDEYEPSILTRYIINLSGMFSKYYNNTQILVEDENLKLARLSLVYSVGLVIKEGLKILGIECPNKM